MTPGNRHDLLFDDVLWVEQARKDHADFVGQMADRGIEVVELRELLQETVDIAGVIGPATGFVSI